MNCNEKILYLLLFLSGPPKKIVEGYQFVQKQDAYREAKRTLERRFGHPAVVAEAFLKGLKTGQGFPLETELHYETTPTSSRPVNLPCDQ